MGTFTVAEGCSFRCKGYCIILQRGVNYKLFSRNLIPSHCFWLCVTGKYTSILKRRVNYLLTICKLVMEYHQ